MNREIERPQNGHSEASEVETLSSEPKVIDARDYTEHASVYKIRAARTSGGWLHEEISEVSRVLINEGVRMAILMERSATPLPLELVINQKSKMIYCGKQFDIERNISDDAFANHIKETMDELGIGFMSVMRNGWDSNVYISFGHGDEAEYFASVHLIFPSEEEGVF